MEIKVYIPRSYREPQMHEDLIAKAKEKFGAAQGDVRSKLKAVAAALLEDGGETYFDQAERALSEFAASQNLPRATANEIIREVAMTLANEELTTLLRDKNLNDFAGTADALMGDKAGRIRGREHIDYAKGKGGARRVYPPGKAFLIGLTQIEN